MRKLFCCITFLSLFHSPLTIVAQRGGCLNDIVSPNAIVITTETTESTPVQSWYVCIGPLHYMDDGVGNEGYDTFYVDQQGTLDLQKCSECFVKALAPATVNLYSNGGPLLEFKCDSGVSVFLDGSPMIPYPCSCNPFVFIDPPANCPVGIEELFSETSDVTVYPNPADKNLTFHWKNIPGKDIYFEVYNVTLNRALSGIIKGGTEFSVLPVSSLQSGFYFVRLNRDEASEVKSFIKM